MKLVHVFTLMIFTAVPSWIPRVLDFSTNDQQVCVDLEHLVQAPLLPELKEKAEHYEHKDVPNDDGKYKTGYVWRKKGANNRIPYLSFGKERRTKNVARTFPVHSDWLCNSSPFADVGREYAFQVGSKRALAEPWEPASKKLITLEVFVIHYYKELLSTLVDVLSVRLEKVTRTREILTNALLFFSAPIFWEVLYHFLRWLKELFSGASYS